MMTYKEKRKQRIVLANKIFAQYQESCLWCPIKRPGKDVNMVDVQVPGSHGMCRECFEILKEEIEKEVQERRAKEVQEKGIEEGDFLS